MFFKPPPPVGAGGGYMFSGRPSVRACVRASVRPSVTRVDQSKTAEVRIMQFSPYSSPIPLVVAL